MKAWLAVVALVMLGAARADAADIRGKWGIGAGVFSGGGEVSLIRGRSERTAWLLEFHASGNNNDTRRESGATVDRSSTNSFEFAGGPGLRRFTRPEAQCSPYFDVRLRAGYFREHLSSFLNRTAFTTSMGLAFGVEYFTRWHVSVAAHSGIADISMYRDRDKFLDGPFGRLAKSWSATVSLSPSLFARAYF